MGKEEFQDISYMLETNCVNIFLSFKRNVFTHVLRIVVHLHDWSPQCKATSLLDAYCLIHSNTHLHHTLASSPAHTHFLSDNLTSNRQHREPEGAKRLTQRLQIKYRWNFTWGVLGLQWCFYCCTEKRKEKVALQTSFTMKNRLIVQMQRARSLQPLFDPVIQAIDCDVGLLTSWFTLTFLDQRFQTDRHYFLALILALKLL